MNTAVDRIIAMGRKRWMRRHHAPTFVFADLAGYTALTEERGDVAAAEITRAFRRAMRELARKHGGWQVKSMGDGVMIWTPEAAAAVELASETVREIGTAPEFLPVRVGVHTGPAVMSGLDWYGSTVNVAARLADRAEPNQALISSSTVQAAIGGLARPPRARREVLVRGLERPVIAWRLY